MESISSNYGDGEAAVLAIIAGADLILMPRDAAKAILTTDLIDKQIAFQASLGGKSVRIGGMAKGSGMIHHNMATM